MVNIYEPVTNDLDFIKGCHPFLQIAPYVTAGGDPDSGQLISIGNVEGVEFDFDGTVKTIESDCTVYDIDAYLTKVKASLKFTILEADMRKMFIGMGMFEPEAGASPDFSDPVNPVIIEGSSVSGGSTGIDGTATGLVGEPLLLPWQIQLSVGAQSFQSDPTLVNVYVGRKATFWRCIIIPKQKIVYKRDDHIKYAVEAMILKDSSVTTKDKLYKVVDIYPHPVAP